MKKLFSVLLLAACFTAPAQKKFDSVAYTNFNSSRWEKIAFAELSKTVMKKNLGTEEKLTGLSKCWAEAKYNFANFDLVPALNWDSLYAAFIPKVMVTKSTVDYYRVLQNFYFYLRDGHTAVMMPASYRKEMSGRLPLQVRWVENKVLVVENNSLREGEKAIKAGAELTAINGEAVQAYIQKNVSPYLHFSTPQDSTERIYRYELFQAKVGEQWQLSFKTPEGKTIQQTFRFEAIQSRLPLLLFTVLPGNIGYLQLNSFGDEKIVQQFDSVFSAMAKTEALIIDVRNNGGGNGGNGFEILGYLTDKPFYTSKSMLRQYRPVGRSWEGVEKGSVEENNWKPYKNKLYNQPVVVLTGGATYSAAEDFTATFKNMKRGIVIGEPSGGSTGQPVFFMLPGGGVGYVCAKRDFFSDGTEFVGVGIQPDVVVHATAKSIAAGKDDVLNAAINYLQKK
ncbi:MAG TPA: S41 family peptidase [Flavisolibacter sp.]|nr:S41 family peptidase [Flavisolibacter sp.]